MNTWEVIRNAISYIDLALPVAAVVVGFVHPNLKGMRFALYPAWLLTKISSIKLFMLIPAIRHGGQLWTGSPINLIEIIELLASILALVIAYLVLHYYLKCTHNIRSNSIIDSVMYFLAITLMLIPFGNWVTQDMDILSVVLFYADTVLPVIFVTIIWHQKGSLAPGFTAKRSLWKVRATRLILFIGIVMMTIAHFTPRIIGWPGDSASAVLGSVFFVVYVSMIAKNLLIAGMCLFEYIRYTESRPDNVHQINA